MSPLPPLLTGKSLGRARSRYIYIYMIPLKGKIVKLQSKVEEEDSFEVEIYAEMDLTDAPDLGSVLGYNSFGAENYAAGFDYGGRCSVDDVVGAVGELHYRLVHAYRPINAHPQNFKPFLGVGP